MIAIELRKRQALNADPKAIQKLSVQEIQKEMELKIQRYFSLLLKNQKKLFHIFHRKL